MQSSKTCRHQQNTCRKIHS